MPVIKQSPQAVSKVVLALRKGGVVIVPTDTVYGFLADAANKKAVAKIYNIKKRAASKPLPLFVSGISTAKEIAEVANWGPMKKRWPGAYTFVIKRKAGVKLYGAEKETVAVRIPKYPFLQKVLKEFGRPVVQTSVNVSGKIPLQTISDIMQQFGATKNISLIIDGGDLKKAQPSKIIDATGTPLKVLRV